MMRRIRTGTPAECGASKWKEGRFMRKSKHMSPHWH